VGIPALLFGVLLASGGGGTSGGTNNQLQYPGKITKCYMRDDGHPEAQLSVTNTSSSLAVISSDVGFYANGVQIAEGNDITNVPAGQTALVDITDATTSGTYTDVTCKILS
jgi:hypothetical protein